MSSQSSSSSSRATPNEQQLDQDEPDLDDPLCITESDIRQFKQSEKLDVSAVKRKLIQVTDEENIKKPKTDENAINEISDSDNEQGHNDDFNELIVGKNSPEPSPITKMDPIEDEPLIDTSEQSEHSQQMVTNEDIDVAEKLKQMNEISVKSISKTEKEQLDQNSAADDDEKVSIEITKKDKKEMHERKVQNLRKNIKDVIDDSQLDATTLAAQRQELERLTRVQEQQRIIRETQRQMAAEKHANKTQQKVLSLLQGESSEQSSSSAIDLDDPLLEKLSFRPSLNTTSDTKTALQSLQSLISTDDQIPDTDEDTEDDDVIIKTDESPDKSKAVVVDSSSDSDDCIILSDDEEEEEIEEDESNSGEHTNDAFNKPDSEGRVVVNIGHGEKEENIYVAPQISRVIKPHQIGGVRFLFDNIIESIELFDKSSGFGCILAHSMGLGKTLQLVCFCDIFLRHTSSRTILIIMPINTLQNWLHEFNMWIPAPEDVDKNPLTAHGEVRPRNFNIHVLNDSQKTLSARAKVVLDWTKEGGVLMMGYEIYRLLSLKKMATKKKKRGIINPEGDAPTNEDQDLFDKIYEALVRPGPDLVVCDEGHRIKNAHASTSLALKQIKSKRRIVLTGYPLQNNLLEYWCMVDFVRPSYLGTKTEFANMFERPIQNGQCIDSTPQDCKLMRYRAHVLHSLLKGFVQRRSHSVLQKCLPEKTEFVLLIRMTPFQRNLYNVFMNEVVRSKKVPNPLKAFSVCCKIWNHPDVLQNFLKKRELDLEIELEETEAIGKEASSKRRGRKTKEPTKDKKSGTKDECPKVAETKSEISENSNSNTTKSSATNDSGYSSTMSTPSSFEPSAAASGSFNPYSSYHNYDASSTYQNYNYNGTNGNGYGSYYNGSNGGVGNFWQNNYYQSPDYSQNYYQQQNSAYPSFYGNTNYQAFDQKQLPKLDPPEMKPQEAKKESDVKNEGGLLADVIKEEKDAKESGESDVKDQIIAKASRDDGIPYDWAVELMKDYVSDVLENSPKMQIFFCILEESIRLGDRLLVFSQSLLTLNILERFLQHSQIPDTETFWAKNQTYFRLDGSTAAQEREKLINEFNCNPRVKLFLVSTRAGSLGINLVGANRVIVFDASWNPCHDTQAVCRVYRYGQIKSCYVYRLVMDNCLEKKIYDRQINKQGMADRVVDECNPDAHLSMREVTSLCYDDGEDPEIQDFTHKKDKYEDLVTHKILEFHSKGLTREPFQHESLLVDRKEKKLSQAEKRLAQRGYEMEKQAATKASFNYNTVGTNYRAYRTPDGSIVHRPVSSGRNVQTDVDHINSIRAGNSRPNRWVPVEVWQSKGLSAQEMTLPQDVSIQTNSADKSKIFLKAGQKVIILKSSKGICLQLESGKVIAIRASMKGNQPCDPKSVSGFPNLTSAPLQSSVRPSGAPKTDGDVIDISNDDDDDDEVAPTNGVLFNVKIAKRPEAQIPTTLSSSTKPPEVSGDNEQSEIALKEKVVYKPNLVLRRSKMPPPATPSQENSIQGQAKPYASESGFQQNSQRPRWDINKPNFSNHRPSNTASSNYYHHDTNGNLKNNSVPPAPFRNANEISKKTSETLPIQPNDSAFHPPAGATQFPSASTTTLPSRTFIPSTHSSYTSQNLYPNTPYAGPGNTSSASYSGTGYNYPPYHPPYHSSAAPYAADPAANYSYPPSPVASYNQPQQFPPYGFNYNQMPNPYVAPTSDQIPPATVPPQVPFTTPSSNYGQWNYN